MQQVKRICLIDFSNIFAVFWHALKDEPLDSAQMKTVAYILSRLAEYTHTAICIDSPPYRRTKTFPDYKGQREPKPKTYYEELRRALDELRGHGLHIFGSPGYEADDIIATFVADDGLSHALGCHDVTIISADKDLRQLLNPDVELRSFQTGSLTTVDSLLEQWGITPLQVPDFLALCGDKADNIPGVRLVGPKKATALLESHTCIADLMVAVGAEDAADNFTAMLLSALKAAAPNIQQWLELVTLERDAPINTLQLLEPVKPSATNSFDPDERYEETMSQPPDDFDDARIGSGTKTPPVPPPVPSEQQPLDEPAPPAPASAPQPTPPAPAEPAPAPQPTKALVKAEVLAPVQWSHALEPLNWDDAWRASGLVKAARWFQTKFGSREETTLAIMAGRARGWDMWSSLQNIDIIKGRPSFSSASIIAMAQSHPQCIYLRPVIIEAKSCTWEAMRIGWVEPLRMTYTYEQAELAGLTKPSKRGEPSMWVKRSQEMCTKQAGRMLARVAFADVCAGMYSPDEQATEVSYEVAS